MTRSATAAPVVLLLAYALLVVAWVVSNPPFAAPDETDHYVRAIGIAGGELVGRRVDDYEPAEYEPADAISDVRVWYETLAPDIRSVSVPAGLYGSGVACNALHRERSAACLDDATPTTERTRQVTLVAPYEPAPYVLPGVLARVGDDVFTALRLGRAAAAVVCVVLLAMAIAVLFVPAQPLLSLIGLLAATTPMVVFTASVLNPSGPEICAGIAFFAGLLRLTRGAAGTWPWLATAVAGAVLVLSRSTGVAWLLLEIVLAAIAAPRWTIVRENSRRAAMAAAAIGGAVVLSLAWSVAYGPSATVSLGTFAGRLKEALGVLPLRLTEEVGRFGWLDSPMPTLAVMAWQALIVALVAVAIVVGSRRERVAVALAAVLALAVPVLFSAWFRGLTLIGDVQGRHVLPFVVSLPLLAGEVLLRNAQRLETLRAVPLALVVPFVAAGGHLVAWTWNAHRHAVGAGGPVLFLRHPEWQPPLGWWTWAAVAGIGAALIVVGGLLSTRRAVGSRS